MIEDVRHALRIMGRQRSLTAVAVLTLALGLGANTALFAVVYGVLLRPLPWPEAGRLVRLSESHQGGRSALPHAMLSSVTYEAWTAAPQTIEGIGAWSEGTYTVAFAGEPERVRGASLSPALFRLLGTQPLVGRFFSEAEGARGGEAVVVLSAGLWRERFAAVPGVVGRLLPIDGRAHRIVGVAPQGFAFPDRDARLFTPYVVVRPEEGSMRVFSALARLRTGVTTAQAAAEGTAAARSHPRPPLANLFFGEGSAAEVSVRPLAEEMAASVRPALLVLMAGVGLLLLTACANVANLLLSQSLARRKELAVRTALGATRVRLLRLLLTESLALASVGGALGVFLAWGLVRALPGMAPDGFPRLDDVRLGPWALGFGLALSLVAGAVAGIVPALDGSRRELVPALRDAEGGATSGRGPRLRRGLLVGEAALCVVLLIGAGLLMRSFARLVQVDAGYDPSNVLIAELVFPELADPGLGRRASTRDALLERLRATPGVVAAGAGNMVPFAGMTAIAATTLPWLGPDGKPVSARALYYGVTPGYAEALGLRLREGRALKERDAVAVPQPLLVNETFVRSYIRDGRPALGRQMKGAFSESEALSEIVGVVGDVLKGLDTKASPEIYVAQNDDDETLGVLHLVIRTHGNPAELAPVLRRHGREIDPGLTFDGMGTLAARVSTSVGKPRFAMTVFGAFSALALVLAATGLYGVLSVAVSQRRRELSIRAALGASRADLLGLVLRQGLGATVVGVAVGLLAAAGATRLMSGLLFGVTPLDAAAFAGAPLLLLVVALGACLVPARRAAATDPAEALRCE